MQALIAAIALCATLFAPGSGASAQTARGVYRLGFLSPAGTLEPSIPSAANIVPKLLRDSGYVEGRNLEIQRRFANADKVI